MREEPHLTQIILPPSDLSEIKLPLPHLAQNLFLFRIYFKTHRRQFNYKLLGIM